MDVIVCIRLSIPGRRRRRCSPRPIASTAASPTPARPPARNPAGLPAGAGPLCGRPGCRPPARWPGPGGPVLGPAAGASAVPAARLSWYPEDSGQADWDPGPARPSMAQLGPARPGPARPGPDRTSRETSAVSCRGAACPGGDEGEPTLSSLLRPVPPPSPPYCPPPSPPCPMVRSESAPSTPPANGRPGGRRITAPHVDLRRL
jgi:hypothetical protein